MLEHIIIAELENNSEEYVLININSIFFSLLNAMEFYLKFDPYYKTIKLKIIKSESIKTLNYREIFKIGVKKYIKNNFLIIEINENYKKFIKFIVLRELYNLFIPKTLQNFKIVHIVINQIIMTNLSKSPILTKWKELIRGNLEHYDSLSRGFNRLSEFDRLEKLFKRFKTRDYHDPIQFFFYYLRRNSSLISDNIDYFFDIFLYEFSSYISRSMINDEIIETIRCLTYIFYKVKGYRNLVSYKEYFQKFKENGEIISKLSLRKFTKNMNWIKKYSYIAPSYQLNWNAINVCVIAIFLRFNPKLKKSQVFKIVENLPFFSSPKFSISSFSVDLCGYIILPKDYLDDFISFINSLKRINIIINQYCLLRNSQTHLINLNYFRENFQKNLIINPNHRFYDKKYEIKYQIDFGNKFYNQELSLLDFLMIDRIRMFSISGLGFESRTKTLDYIKSDFLNEIITQRTIIKNLKKILLHFHHSDELRNDFIEFVDKNGKFGFFYIKKKIESYLRLLILMEELINNNPTIKNFTQFRNFIENDKISHLIEDNLLIKKKTILGTILRDYISLFFRLKKKYIDNVEKLRKFGDLIKSCYNLKILNLNDIKKIILNQNLIESIFKTKDEKFEQYYEKFKDYKLKTKQINDIIDKFLNKNPSIISPLLINTIITKKYYNDFLQLILINSEETRKSLEIIKIYFPRILINNTKDLITNENYVYVEISTPQLNKKEEELFYSIIFNLFKDNVVYAKNYLWSGIIEALSSKNFYDFEKGKFFYTKDLYEQYFLFVKRVLRDELGNLKEKNSENRYIYWSKDLDLMKLIDRVNNRIKNENKDFNMIHLNKLLNFHFNLKKNLLKPKKFHVSKQEYFFTNYIKSIKFIPAFQYYGLGQYFLYLYPSDINKIDFKLLLQNTFQKIKYPACIDSSNSLFIKYIIPHGAPLLKYLHWLTKSKKVIREYCGFFIKKIYQILQFSQNISSEGWVYNKDSFKMHMQNILFKSGYNFQIPEIKEYNITDEFISSFLGPESLEFESLSNIYNWHSIDIKSFLRTKKAKTVNHIINLLEKGLIFPYLSLKNLDLHDKVYIIIPNLKPELNNTFVKIFSFFNFAFIYEIEGEYFIYGFEQEEKFQNGLMIKIYFPKCELSEFIRLFDLLFESLEIKDYIILNDLVDGKNLIKSIYGGLAFLDSYNPLKNLEWNEQDKIWQNSKIFTSKFKPIYPDLISKYKK